MSWGQAIGIGMNLLGAATGLFGASAATKQQYKYQSRLQAQQQQWLERMSNTAHQREVQDLQEAGLNPLLSAMGGQGASTPASGMGQINAPDYGAALEGISTAQQIKMNNVQAKNIKADTELKGKQALTEEAKKLNFEQNTAVQAIDEVIKQAEADNANKKWIEFLENLRADTKMKNASSALQISEIETEKFKRMLMKSETKYNNERARGYSESESRNETENGDWGYLPGMHYGSGKGYSYSRSRTY